MNEAVYEIYKITKNLIERSENCCEKDHSTEELFTSWKNAIEHLDAANRGYAERYEKEKKDESSM